MLSFPHVCAFDQSVHADLDSLYRHLKRFRVARVKYFHTYLPRKDLFNGELIPFESVEQYYSQDFINKVTLKQWLKKESEKGREWAKQWLARRKVDKQLIYAPSQAELRTLNCPSMPYYDAAFVTQGGYYGVTTELGFASRYTDEDPHFTPLASDAIVICDTREQAPLRLAVPTRNETVSVGDYALAAPYDKGVRIERKSLNDFAGTLNGRKNVRANKKKGDTVFTNLERFERELARAREQDLYVIMCVESDINDAQRFNYLPHMQHVKASPAYIMHNLRELLVRYPLHFQVLFLDGRIQMAQTVVRLFQMGEQVKRIDLQHAHEEGLL